MIKFLKKCWGRFCGPGIIVLPTEKYPGKIQFSILFWWRVKIKRLLRINTRTYSKIDFPVKVRDYFDSLHNKKSK